MNDRRKESIEFISTQLESGYIDLGSLCMNPLARKILIFYKDEDWANKMLHELASVLNDNIGEDNFSLNYSKHDKYIAMNEGTSVRFVSCYTSACGYRCHEAYLQEGIDERFYKQVIARCCTIGRGACFIMKDVGDLFAPIISVNSYYLHLNKLSNSEELFEREYE